MERVARDEERGFSAQLGGGSLVGGDDDDEEGRSSKAEKGMSTQAMKGEPERCWQVVQ